MKIGALSGCHQKYERSFRLFGFQLPLCARCTGILAGQLIAFLALFCGSLYSRTQLSGLLILAAAFIIILGVDGVGQLKGFWVSNNPRRFITGILCGFFTTAAFIALVLHAVNFVYGSKILP